MIVYSFYFSFYGNSGSSKRSELFKNLIVDFKIDWFVLTLKYSLQRKRKWSFVSVSIPHLHIGSTVFLKLYLNLCSFKWLKVYFRRAVSFMPLMSRIAKTEFFLGLIKLRIISLNLFTDTMFRISSLSTHYSLKEHG